MENQRVVAAVRSRQDLEDALRSPARKIFLLSGELCQLAEDCARLRQAKKQIFLHIDLVDGLKGDESGLRFAAQNFHINGIISTRASTLKLARENGLLAIQRVFVIDSLALQTGVAHAQQARPDFVEVLPGISSEIIQLAVRAFSAPVIAGGLISSAEDVKRAVGAGAAAVSSSRRELWGL